MNIHETNGRSVTEALPKGFTYFIRDEDQIKIGSSMTPEQRIKGIEMQSGRSVQRLAIVAMEVCDEFQTHRKFAHLRLRGEWFQAVPELLDFIKDLKVAAGDYVEPEPEPPVRLARKPLPDPVIRGVLKRRNKVGSQTPEGHVLSNIFKQSQWLDDPDPRPWATHPTQTIQWMMNWQLKLLAKYSAA